MVTELDTVNRMLSAAGLAPVADASTPHPAYQKALTKLLQVSTTLQSPGHWFNKSEVTLSPTVDGKVYLPQLAVRVNTLDGADSQIVMRGPVMFDLAQRTDVISRTLRCSMVEALEFTVLPLPAADYIATRAVLEFFVEQGGQDPKLSVYRALAQDAELRFKKEALANHRPVQPTYRRTRQWDKLFATY